MFINKIMTNKYVKKQLPVEVVLWNGDNLEEIKKIIKPFVFANNCEDRQYFIADGDETDNSIYFTGFFNHGFSNLRLPINHYLIIKRRERNIDCYLSTCNEEEFEAEYEQQNSNHSSKPSDFSLRDLVMKFAQPHIKYYVKRLEEYGFKLKYINEAEIKEESAYIPFTVLEDEKSNQIWISNRKRGRGKEFQLIMPQYKDGQTERHKYFRFEVKDNNWREAFNKLVASFPDEIMKNTNHHANLSS